MKFLIVAALALSAVCAEELKKTEKRGLSSLGYGGYGSALGYNNLGYGNLGYSNLGAGYGGYSGVYAASPVVSKVSYNTVHGGDYGYSGLGAAYPAYSYPSAYSGAGYGYAPAVSYSNTHSSYPVYSSGYGGHSGLGYSGLGYSGAGYTGLGYSGHGYSGLGYSGAGYHSGHY